MRELQEVEQRLAAEWAPESWSDVTVLVAVSAGADSVALACALARVKQTAGGPGRLAIGHLNHRWRGIESDADETFVQELAERLGLPSQIGRAAPPEPGRSHHGDGPEAVARRLRYTFLQETAETIGARYVVTGHTADDQAETVLHRIVRGTGIAGLAGIPRARRLGPAATLIRPLLTARRSDLVGYLEAVGQPYRQDPSNDDPRFTRNRIRRNLMPHLESAYNSQVVDALVRLGHLAAGAQGVIDALVDDLVPRAATFCSKRVVVIDCGSLRSESRTLVRELFKGVWLRQQWPRQAMGFAEWDRLASCVLAPIAEHQPPTMPGGVRVRLERSRMVLERPTSPQRPCDG